MTSSNDNLAESVKRFITFHRAATLSTISSSVKGYPFASLVPFDIQQQSEIIIFISLISEHYRNIQKDPRASIFVRDEFAHSNPQAHARATLLGQFKEIDSKEIEERYWLRFPDAPEQKLAHNFLFYQMKVERVRWIGGFGQISWISGDDFAKAAFDEIAYIGEGICQHMNYSHQDSLSTLVEKSHGESLDHRNLTMTRFSSVDMEIRFKDEHTEKRYKIDLPCKLESQTHAREVIISMLKD
jgi:putative heme iron utilization protein